MMLTGSKQSIDPHCRVWARARAALWGTAPDHYLDEPVCLTEDLPVRAAFYDNARSAVLDRALSFRVLRPGTHVALRITFKAGKFFEVEVAGVSAISVLDKSVEVPLC